jgi:hypothetical protein
MTFNASFHRLNTNTYGANACLAVPTVVTTYVIQDLNEKIVGVDCMMH